MAYDVARPFPKSKKAGRRQQKGLRWHFHFTLRTGGRLHRCSTTKSKWTGAGPRVARPEAGPTIAAWIAATVKEEQEEQEKQAAAAAASTGVPSVVRSHAAAATTAAAGGGGAAGARVSALATQSATQPARLHVSFVHVHPLAETSLDLEMRGVVRTPITLPHTLTLPHLVATPHPLPRHPPLLCCTP